LLSDPAGNRRRIAYCSSGQETFGWDWKPGDYYAWPHPPLATLAEFQRYNLAIEALVDVYSAFHFARHQPKTFNSPFWRAFRLLLESIGHNAPTDILWTNLFRCDLDGSVINGSTPEELREILSFQRGLLTSEVRVLKPTAVLFFTGPDYDVALRDEFADVTTEPVMGRAEREFARLRHPQLPGVAVRTYHPAYLMRTGRWAWLDDISHLVMEQMS